MNFLPHELCPVVRDESCGDTEPGDYLVADKPDCVFLGDGPECFGFRPLGHIIDSHHDKLEFPAGFGEWSHNVDSPHSEWDRGEYGNWDRGGCARDVAEELTLVACSDKCFTILCHGWPIVSLAQDFMCKGLARHVVPAYALVNFPHAVCRFVVIDAFENGGVEVSTVENIVL